MTYNQVQNCYTMKKIIALFVIMLAAGVTANAQQKQAVKQAPATTATAAPVDDAFKVPAQKDLDLLMQTVTLDAKDQESFFGLFKYKHRSLSQNLSAERKEVLYKSIEAKIAATLDPDQNEKLAKSPDVLQRLIH